MRRHVSHGCLLRRWPHDSNYVADCVTNTDGNSDSIAYRVANAYMHRDMSYINANRVSHPNCLANAYHNTYPYADTIADAHSLANADADCHCN